MPVNTAARGMPPVRGAAPFRWKKGRAKLKADRETRNAEFTARCQRGIDAPHARFNIRVLVGGRKDDAALPPPESTAGMGGDKDDPRPLSVLWERSRGLLCQRAVGR